MSTTHIPGKSLFRISILWVAIILVFLLFFPQKRNTWKRPILCTKKHLPWPCVLLGKWTSRRLSTTATLADSSSQWGSSRLESAVAFFSIVLVFSFSLYFLSFHSCLFLSWSNSLLCICLYIFSLFLSFYLSPFFSLLFSLFSIYFFFFCLFSFVFSSFGCLTYFFRI